MNKEFKTAEILIREVVRSLRHKLGEDGEDITCFFHHSLDSQISTLIAARTHMALGEAMNKTVALNGRVLIKKPELICPDCGHYPLSLEGTKTLCAPKDSKSFCDMCTYEESF